jgi:F420-dependent oxidoreductase-like protein
VLELAIMIEGQNGLNWERWKRMARAVEDLGYVGLYRSDHYTNMDPPDQDSLELWVSLTWLATNTERIEFGPLVSPVSFRHPTMTARMAGAVHELSGGRLILGLGAGWQEREHNNYGWDLLEVKDRFERFEEGLEVVSRLLTEEGPVDFEGEYYRLQEAVVLPRPSGPPILIGGNGPKRTLRLAAKYAVEWNGVYLLPDAFSERIELLDSYLDEQGRDPAQFRRSLMAGLEYGRDQAEVEAKVEERTKGKRTLHELRDLGVLVGTGTEIVDQLGALADAGAQRIMLQWLNLDDLDGLEAFSADVMPQVS